MKTKTYFLKFENHQIKISEKKINSIRLKIDFETLEISCSVPKKFPISKIMDFLESKKNWIENSLKRFSHKKPDPNLIKFFGKDYPFKKTTDLNQNKLDFDGQNFQFYLNNKTSSEILLYKFYLNSLKDYIHQIKPIYEEKLNTKIFEIRYRKMKTRWGTCIPSKKKIWLNIELAKKNKNEIEYVLAHEMVHFFESGHGIKFKNKLTEIFPNWKETKKSLNH